MHRYFRIFLFYCQNAFEYRSLSVVWFLSSLAVPLLMLVFWLGATKAQGSSVFGWNYSDFATYYLFVALANSLFVAHIEDSVATEDINKGELARYILKPFPYFSFNLLGESPWRLIQGVFAVISILIIAFFAPGIVHMTSSPLLLTLAILTAFFAFLMSFAFKMCIGLLAFWFTEIGGIIQLNEIIFSICAGVVIPLVFLPESLKLALNILPFSYIVYYPILAFLGKLTLMQELQVILVQLIWMAVFVGLYKILWRAGRRKFTTVGQ